MFTFSLFMYAYESLADHSLCVLFVSVKVTVGHFLTTMCVV